MAIKDGKRGDCHLCNKPILENDGFSVSMSKGRPDEYTCISCHDKRARLDFLNKGEIRTFLWTDAIFATIYNRDGKILSLEESSKLMADMEDVERFSKMYESLIWLRGMHSQVNACKTRGMSGVRGSLKVMAYEMCGRVLITLQDKYPGGHKRSRYDGAHLTLITTDDGKARMGIQSVIGTKEEACNLLSDAILSHPKMSSDGDVSII